MFYSYTIKDIHLLLWSIVHVSTIDDFNYVYTY